ncbi:MAG TPA: ATP-binding protein [Puia sp.]|nr:ATP-binding protein [Puia sp.]
MQPSSSQIISLVIIISTLLLLIFGGIIVRYIFLYQRKKDRHNQEVARLGEEFKSTLLQSKLEIQEQTLDHIAKELHANFSHLVSLININLSEILPQSTSEMKDNIMETKSLAKQLLVDLKALSASLNTDHTIHIGFARALDNELIRLGNRKKYAITFTCTGDDYRLSPEHEIILFRLCQEVLNNILKYAKARSIRATLTYSPEFFSVEISDDGIGFDVDLALSHSAERESTGLLNIKKRATLINAAVQMRSLPNEGTTIVITIPKQPKI